MFFSQLLIGTNDARITIGGKPRGIIGSIETALFQAAGIRQRPILGGHGDIEAEVLGGVVKHRLQRLKLRGRHNVEATAEGGAGTRHIQIIEQAACRTSRQRHGAQHCEQDF